METQYIYRTKFKFDNDVRSIKGANKVFKDNLGWYSWVKEDLASWIGKDKADKIVDLTWRLEEEDSGYIKLVSTEELDDQTLETLGKWIKDQCDTHEEDLFVFEDAFNYGYVSVHFDHEGNDYKPKLFKVK